MKFLSANAAHSIVMFSAAAATLSRRGATAFAPSVSFARRSIRSTAALQFAAEGQAEVVLVGCGAPNRGMGWYHAVQMLEKK